MMPNGGIYLGQYGSGNGLVPDGTKPLSENNVYFVLI